MSSTNSNRGYEYSHYTTIQRGIEGAKKLLADYQEPKLDEDKDEELLDFIARRETTIPAMEALNQEY